MATEYIGLPGQLLEKVKEAVAKEKITPEELVRDAVEARLSRAEWRKTLECGERNARERGLTLEDVAAEIAAARARTRQIKRAARHRRYEGHHFGPELFRQSLTRP